jgi:glycosyltransferase involved in cell wall biosynthesis
VKIVFFPKGDRRLPSSRTRVYLVSDYLEAHGQETEIYQVITRPWWDLSLARVRDVAQNARRLWSIQKGDVVLLQRTIHQIDFILLVLLWHWTTGHGYVFDFDDAIFLDKGHSNFKMKLLLRNAALVFASSHALLAYAERYNAHAYILATTIDTDTVYVSHGPRGKDAKVVVGWTGSPSHLGNMRLLVEPIKRLAASSIPFRLMIVGGGEEIPALFSSIEGLDLEIVRIPPDSPLWKDPRNYVPYLQQFDIGLVPLEKTEFNAGKDSHKIKEYMGCRVAAIASAWGEHFYMIEDGKTGRLVDTADDWYSALASLIQNPEERERLAAAGRAYICRESSLPGVVPKMLDLIQNYGF